MPPCYHSNAHRGCQCNVCRWPPRCVLYTLYTDFPESLVDNLSKTPHCTLKTQNAAYREEIRTHQIKRWILGNDGHTVDLEQHLGLGYRGSCHYAPGAACACRAATILLGCTCGCDRNDDLEGSTWKCFCWYALPRRHLPLMETLRTEAVLMFSDMNQIQKCVLLHCLTVWF